VTDSHSHAWVEVYFPEFGWIPFEPTPGESLPDAYQPDQESQSELALSLADLPLSDNVCFAEFDGCDEEEPQPLLPGDGSSGGQGSSFTGIWPWLLGVIGGLAIFGGGSRWFWSRFMAAPSSPRVAFQRMTRLASLASAGPTDFQTPYQFGHQLQQALPTQETHVSIIVASYVRNRYGNNTQTPGEQSELSEAWQRLRLPMLWAVIRRRVR